MAKSSIEWTGKTWNPLTGCDKTSQGCKNCYAEVMAKRLQAMGQPKYKDGFKLTLHPDSLEEPLKWKKPTTIFVNSMSDLFHNDVPVEYIHRVFTVMNKANWHTFQVLTKRADNLNLLTALKWTDNIWMGVSVEDRKSADRIKHLRKCAAKVKFLSIEPLLEALPNLDLQGIDWVIVGGESGFNAREMKEEWVIDIRNQCIKAGIPFFFKQWGGKNKKASGRLLEGKIWDEMPRKLSEVS